MNTNVDVDIDKECIFDEGVRIEIGENLLKAIKALLRNIERENFKSLGRVLSPGKEIKKAFGLDLSKMYKSHLKRRQHKVLSLD